MVAQLHLAYAGNFVSGEIARTEALLDIGVHSIQRELFFCYRVHYLLNTG